MQTKTMTVQEFIDMVTIYFPYIDSDLKDKLVSATEITGELCDELWADIDRVLKTIPCQGLSGLSVVSMLKESNDE